jgi:uncharacterized protein
VRRISKSLKPFSAAALLFTGLVMGLGACEDAPLSEDGARLMSAPEAAHLARFHGFLVKDHDIDYRVVTGRGLGEINDYAVKRFASLDVGSRTKSGRGLLLVIDAQSDLVRLEVSSNLEGVYPDAFVAYVEQRQMVPFFRARRVADGILAATELIVTRAQRAKANAGFEGEAWYKGSGGGGAATRARIGAGAPTPSQEGRAAPARRQGVRAGSTPGDTLAAYFRAMQSRNADPGLAIYTPQTRRMLRRWVVTPAQMDNIVRTYRNCGGGETRLDGTGRAAVVRYPVDKRQCSPFFFQMTGGGWALDLTVMQTLIRFGRDNSWHFAAGADNPYAFAFTDWRIDRRGYPRARQR